MGVGGGRCYGGREGKDEMEMVWKEHLLSVLIGKTWSDERLGENGYILYACHPRAAMVNPLSGDRGIRMSVS